ncbi:MAG: osmotically inducible protein OsmC [Anaerolinea sp.]|nr:osmotically inducible protein OsmC [Anaerolinea sp.]
MEAKVIWKSSGLAFNGTADSGHFIALGGHDEIGTPNDGFRPVELLAVGLAGCTAMDVISILQKKKENVLSFEVSVHADREEEYPKVFTQAEILYHITGSGINPASVERAIELSNTKYCPAFAMLSKSFPITVRYEITEVE